MKKICYFFFLVDIVNVKVVKVVEFVYDIILFNFGSMLWLYIWVLLKEVSCLIVNVCFYGCVRIKFKIMI